MKEEEIGSLLIKEFRIMIASELKSLSRVQLLVTPWTVAHQTSSSMGFSRQEYWSGVPLPSPKLRYTNLIYVYHEVIYIILYISFIHKFSEHPSSHRGTK